MNPSDFVKIIQDVAKNIYNNSEPPDIEFGKVESIEPLTIRVNQRLLLTEDELILTNLVKDFKVDIEVAHKTVNDDVLDTLHDHQGVAKNSFDSHHYHAYEGRKKITIYLGLKVGENVVLIKKHGGQKRLVIDRVEATFTEGEWTK